MDPHATHAISGIRTVGIPVRDQEAALRFYVETLGFDVKVDAPLPQPDGRWIEVAPASATISVALVQASDNLPAGAETGIRFTTADATGLHADLTAAGVDVDDLLAWPGVPPMFTLRDLDGNGLVVVQDSE